MRLVALLVPFIPLVAQAETDRGAAEGPVLATTSTPVIGGADAMAGKWPDVAAVIDDTGFQFCTGTLIAPNVVLTAGHCSIGVTPASVLIGTSSLARASEGETIAVMKHVEFPSSQRSVDVTVLVLAQSSTKTPRKIATGWAKLDIKNGAQVAIAGFGAVDRSGPVTFDNQEQYVNELNEAVTTITDANCTINAANGCNPLAAPDGELGAGGMGIDTCPGDSGGPLYLMTDYGTFLAGVTSRSYDDATYWCSEGGIYARPDKIVDWIEEQAGVKVGRGPEPTFDPMMAVRGNAAETKIEANDPKTSQHTFAITTPPAHGTAKIRDDGALRVCTDAGVAGVDGMTVSITDKGDPARVLSVKIPITIEDGTPGSNCSVDAFDDGGNGGGCCDSGRSAGGAIPLSILVLVLLRRRR
jgi:secreted trypsin-like serine protease